MPNLVQNQLFFVLCDLEIWDMTLKTTGHFFYATSSLVHHFVAISELKLDLVRKRPSAVKIHIFFLAVWPWNLTDDLEKQ